MKLAFRLALTAALGLGGAATGVAAVAVHTETWGWPLAVLSAVAVAVALPAARWGRSPWCLGWGGTVLGASFARPEGDYVISADLPGYGLLAVAFASVVTGVLVLAPRRARADTGRGGPPP